MRPKYVILPGTPWTSRRVANSTPTNFIVAVLSGLYCYIIKYLINYSIVLFYLERE